MRRAFALQEIIVSLTIIGLVVVFLLNLLPSALAAQRGADQRLFAATSARSLLEIQQGRPWSELPVGLHQELPTAESDGVVYRASLEVQAAPGVDPKYLRVLRLKVAWTRGGQEHQVLRELWRHQLPHKKTPEAND